MKSCRPSAGSPTPPSGEHPPVVAVAYSGGRDSTALLHATMRAVEGWNLVVLALHVHHGLSANADGWLEHCADQCARWQQTWPQLCFEATRIETRPASGDSIEAWARGVRHDALHRMCLAHGASLLLLAHHRRDQAETLLLQALRGGGLAGLAAMPRTAVRDGLCWARPWIGQPREAIESYASGHRLAWIDDESNDDERLARNRLRRQVWPALVAAFPTVEAALARTSDWAQESLDILADAAAADLASVASSTGIDVAKWLALTPPRRSLALRTWLHRATGTAAPATLVVRLMNELPEARNGATWSFGARVLRRVASELRQFSDARYQPPSASREAVLSVKRAGRIPLPGWGGMLVVRRVREGGVPLAWLGHVELRARSGGERFQSGTGRPARSLKKQYQAAGLTGEERLGPLVFSGGLLVFVPGLGIDARMRALPDQVQVMLDWLPTALE